MNTNLNLFISIYAYTHINMGFYVGGFLPDEDDYLVDDQASIMSAKSTVNIMSCVIVNV
jgi:hypothetical protein